MMPRGPLLALFALAAVPLVAGVWEPAMTSAGVLAATAVLALAVADLALSPRVARVQVEREAPEVMSVGAANAVRLWLRNTNGSPVFLRIHDEPPMPADLIDLPASVLLRPGVTQSAVYHVRPHRRGLYEFGSVFLRMRSRLRLWTLADTRPLPQPVRIFPDIRAVHRVELLARQNRLAQAGVRLSRLRGRGTDFDRLREYRRGDEYRSIDWKSTSKHQQLVSREYVVEKDQTVLFLLDSGRSMCNEADGISHFDRALNAAVLLSYVALRQGDSVGMLVCGAQVNRWVPPVRGPAGVQSIVRQTYDLQPSYDATDYSLMVQQLRLRHRKRSLVVLVSHAMDEVHMRSIAAALRQMRSPHLALGAFLRNVPLYERLQTVPRTDLEAFQVAAAAEMIGAEAEQVAQLEHSGLKVVEALPEELSARLINQYLEIKARHLL
jgi:uncharacterized protein (DUF58 family)